MRGYPYAFYIALDGNGANGLEGMAGMCLFLYDASGSLSELSSNEHLADCATVGNSPPSVCSD